MQLITHVDVIIDCAASTEQTIALTNAYTMYIYITFGETFTVRLLNRIDLDCAEAPLFSAHTYTKAHTNFDTRH